MFEHIKRFFHGGAHLDEGDRDGFTPAAPREAQSPEGSGQSIYLESLRRGRGSDEFRFRGFVGPKDDPESYTKMMAKHGLRVIVSDKHLGPLINHDGNPIEET